MPIENNRTTPTRRTGRPASVTVAGVVVGIALAACTGPGGSRAVDPPTLGPAAAHDLHTIVEQPRSLGRAEAYALRSCLQQKGFDPPLTTMATGSTANLPVFLDEPAAGREGYGAAMAEARQLGRDDLGRYAERLPPARRAAFDATLDDDSGPKAELTTPNGWVVRAGTTGCMATARSAVYGSVENWLLAYALPQDLNTTAADVYLEPPVASALQSYQGCMSEQGQPAAFPQEAFAAARAAAGRSAQAVRSAEVRIATADARCQTRSDLERVVRAAFDRLAAPWLARNADLVVRTASVVKAAGGQTPAR